MAARSPRASRSPRRAPSSLAEDFRSPTPWDSSDPWAQRLQKSMARLQPTEQASAAAAAAQPPPPATPLESWADEDEMAEYAPPTLYTGPPKYCDESRAEQERASAHAFRISKPPPKPRRRKKKPVAADELEAEPTPAELQRESWAPWMRRKHDAGEEAAAAKLQAAERGRQGRAKAKELKGKKIEQDLGLEGTEDEAAAIAKVQAAQRGRQDRLKAKGLKIEKDLGLTGSEEEAAAATKIQAVQRGNQERAKAAEEEFVLFNNGSATEGEGDVTFSFGGSASEDFSEHTHGPDPIVLRKFEAKKVRAGVGSFCLVTIPKEMAEAMGEPTVCARCFLRGCFDHTDASLRCRGSAGRPRLRRGGGARQWFPSSVQRALRGQRAGGDGQGVAGAG